MLTDFYKIGYNSARVLVDTKTHALRTQTTKGADIAKLSNIALRQHSLSFKV